MIGATLTNYRDWGLMLMRIGLGLAFITHGVPKIMGGPKLWEAVGGSVGLPAPVVFGFIAAMSETFGGILLLLGLAFRVGCVLLLGVMIGALTSHLRKGQDFNAYSHALEDGVVFAGLLFVGPGKFSVDRK